MKNITNILERWHHIESVVAAEIYWCEHCIYKGQCYKGQCLKIFQTDVNTVRFHY